MDTISAKQLDYYLRDRNSLVIDLRSEEDYREKHLRGALNIPAQEAVERLAIRRDRRIVLYCERGVRSMAVARELEARGCRNIISVVGGIRAYRGTLLEFGK